LYTQFLYAVLNTELSSMDVNHIKSAKIFPNSVINRHVASGRSG